MELIFPKLIDLKLEDQYISFIARKNSTAKFIGLDIKELDRDPLNEFIFDLWFALRYGSLEYCLLSINQKGIRKYTILKSGGFDSEEEY